MHSPELGQRLIPWKATSAFGASKNHLASFPGPPESLRGCPGGQRKPESVSVNLDSPWLALRWINNRSGDVPVHTSTLFR